MAIDLEKFRGTLPYASELFGVYQPLIGWKSRLGRVRVDRERLRNLSKLTEMMARDPTVRELVGSERAPVRPDAPLALRAPGWLHGAVARQLEAGAEKFRAERGRTPGDADWAAVVRTLPLTDMVKALSSNLKPGGRAAEDGGRFTLVRKREHTTASLRALAAVDVPGTDLAVVRSTSKAAGLRRRGSPGITAAVQAGALQYAAELNPSVLSAALSQSLWRSLVAWLDPLALFDPETHDAVLSPLGVLHLFREYFFEFDSFLGPPVGHVWVSPGGSLELFETHSRKTIEQREIELRTETIDRAERSKLSEDELSSKVSAEKSSNLSVAQSVSGGVNFGVWQAQGSTNIGYQTSHRSAQETSHKSTRQQSEKISSEMRRDFKTTFRTTVEVNDTSSRRHTLANDTGRLLNIEFRRKMRQIGVQVQHLGAQLCWQAYVDNPGADLGVAELVHIAKRGDLTGQLQPPEAPVLLTRQENELSVLFSFDGITEDPTTGDTYIDGVNEDDDSERIVHVGSYDASPPAAGYTLAGGELVDVQGTDPSKDPPIRFACSITPAPPTAFVLTLNEVNFNDQPQLRIALRLTWDPPDQSKVLAEYETKMAEYTEAKSRAAHEEYLRAVRERVKLASQIAQRPTDALRAEERTAIFHRLVASLVAGAGDEEPHVTVELIRAIFEVDKVLYFVAESWWEPRTHARQELSDGTEKLTTNDLVAWGGRQAAGRDNYLITEESAAAPQGASLGWLLQLDGDPHRNAFLNSPFVKAVVPIRPGKEEAALDWLERAEVEGADGLDTPYRGNEPELAGRTLRQALRVLAGRVRADASDMQSVLAAETLFEKGFDPLEGGFRVAEPFQVFDQWIEVLPTEQIVAVDYVVPGSLPPPEPPPEPNP